MKVGYKKKQEGAGIEREDLYELSFPDRVASYYPQFEKDWNDNLQKWRMKWVN